MCICVLLVWESSQKDDMEILAESTILKSKTLQTFTEGPVLTFRFDLC